jgi:hypothetical protein
LFAIAQLLFVCGESKLMPTISTPSDWNCV